MKSAAVVARAQADAGWETAVAVLKTVLNIAFDTVSSPTAMLRMKDFVLLVCSALGAPLRVHPRLSSPDAERV